MNLEDTSHSLLIESLLSNIKVWHASKQKFDSDFSENRIGTGNDDGYAGRGFYFFADERDAQFAVPVGFKRQYILSVKRAFNLDKDDIFSEDPPKGMSYSEYRDQETLKLLKLGYQATYRSLNGKIEEICVLSFKKHGFDGNKLIKPLGKWQSINK